MGPQRSWELFDLKADPGEKNVLADQPETAKQLEAAYDRWWEEILPCLENENAEPPQAHPYFELYEKQFGSLPKA
jgi:hypothetical protein